MNTNNQRNREVSKTVVVLGNKINAHEQPSSDCVAQKYDCENDNRRRRA